MFKKRLPYFITALGGFILGFGLFFFIITLISSWPWQEDTAQAGQSVEEKVELDANLSSSGGSSQAEEVLGTEQISAEAQSEELIYLDFREGQFVVAYDRQICQEKSNCFSVEGNELSYLDQPITNLTYLYSLVKLLNDYRYKVCPLLSLYLHEHKFILNHIQTCGYYKVDSKEVLNQKLVRALQERGSLLTVDKGNYFFSQVIPLWSIDSVKVKEYIDSLDKNSLYKKEKLVYPKNKKVKVSVIKNDWRLDPAGSVGAIEKRLEGHLMYLEADYIKRGVINDYSHQEFVMLPLRSGLPSTNGNFKPRYIEVDNSLQKIFAWENGELIYDFGMSGAYERFNQFGVHRILNKSKRAWSDIAEKWMPFWMAYAYDRKQSAWLGIHGLVYWEENGRMIYEPETNIGTPKSAGCLRLKDEDIRKLYKWARVGDWVVVHP